MSDLTVVSHGMGVDSVAFATAALRGDNPRPLGFDPSDMLVTIAMTGHESRATWAAMQHKHLPVLKAHGVRVVQLARAGMSQTDGIVVLSDTGRGDPYDMVMRGPVTLVDYLDAGHIVPQVSNRNCSYWAKGWVLDTYAREYLHNADRVHIVGFAAEETRRARKDDAYSRKAPGKIPVYPLIDWGWNREKCLAYLWDQYGIEWPRSCCGFCPFQLGDRDKFAERWRAEPDQAELAVALETRALGLSDRAKLFGGRTALDVARSFGLGDVADRACATVLERRAALYRVRRIYRRNGDHRDPITKQWMFGPDPDVRMTRGSAVWRSVSTIATGSRTEMLDELHNRARRGGRLDVGDRSARLVLAEPGAPWPSTEEYLAVGVAGADKQQDAFESLWAASVAEMATLPRQTTVFDALDAYGGDLNPEALRYTMARIVDEIVPAIQAAATPTSLDAWVQSVLEA